MFRKINKLKSRIVKISPSIIPKIDINQGVNCLNNFIIYRKKDTYQVYDRKCDHAGGKIISRNSKHICPMHNWEFDPIAGKYKNGVKKKNIPFKETKEFLTINNIKILPQITKLNPDKRTKITLRFFNHAFIIIETPDCKFATDPWAFGPAFNNGWWLTKPTKKDWLNEINSVDFIYISHNHPDHLHELTLSKIDKNIKIIVPKFTQDSVGKYIETLKFKDITRLDFLEEYKFNNTDVVLSLLKSGDFREDSGLYISINNFSILMDVDANTINFGHLPEVDLYCSSFGGGASGYPLMFDNYDENQKKEITNKKILFVKQKKIKNLKQIRPKYFLPYASFFSENLKRDKFIKKNNKKNKIEDYENYCSKNNIKILNVEKNDKYVFYHNKVKKIKTSKGYILEQSPEEYLKKFKKDYKKIDEKRISSYFIESGYKDNLIVFISLVNDSFDSNYYNCSVDFSNKEIKFSKIKKININNLFKIKKMKVLYLKIRKESFLNTIENFNPWEDLTIGFQCKILRNPDVYNVSFWNHFTNIYIRDIKKKYNNECNQCEKIIQTLDKDIKF